MDPIQDPQSVRTAELAAALCLATDLGMALPFENGLQSTLVAMRLADRLGLDSAEQQQVYYTNLLFYGGCTADAEGQTEMFAEGAMEHFHPVMFGRPTESIKPLLKTLAAGDGSSARKVARVLRKLPKVFTGQKAHVAAICDIIGIFGDSLGLPPEVTGMFPTLTPDFRSW